MYECDCVEKNDQALVWSSDQCVCTTCARVVETHPMDQGPEWFSDDRARCSPVDQYDVFINSGTLPNAPPVAGKKKYAPPDPAKQLRSGLKHVDSCARAIGVTPDGNMASSAKEVYSDFIASRKCHKKMVRKRDVPVYAAVAMYFGCKMHEAKSSRNPRTLREVAASCDVSQKKCSDAMKEFKTMLHDASYASLLFRAVTAEDLFIRALSGVPMKQKDRCTVLKTCQDMYASINTILSGRTPETVCCVCVYMACERSGIDVDRSTVHTACAVSRATFKNALTFLKQHLKNDAVQSNA